MIQLSEMQRHILLEGLNDYQSIWELVGQVRDELGAASSPAAVRGAVLLALRPLVEGGYVQLGTLTQRGEYSDLTPWPLGGKRAIDELERMWIQLGRDPVIGELAWLQLTSNGEQLASQLEN